MYSMEYNYYSISSSKEPILLEKVALYNKVFKKESIDNSSFLDYLYFETPVRFIISKDTDIDAPLFKVASDNEEFSADAFFDNNVKDFIIYYDENSKLKNYPNILNIDDVLYSLKNELNSPKMNCSAEILKEPALTGYQVLFNIDNKLTFAISIDIDKKIFYLNRTVEDTPVVIDFSQEYIAKIEKFVFEKLLSKAC